MISFGLKARILALTMGAQVVAAGAAYAHGLHITGSAACDPSGKAVISYTVTSTSPFAAPAESRWSGFKMPARATPAGSASADLLDECALAEGVAPLIGPASRPRS